MEGVVLINLLTAEVTVTYNITNITNIKAYVFIMCVS